MVVVRQKGGTSAHRIFSVCHRTYSAVQPPAPPWARAAIRPPPGAHGAGLPLRRWVASVPCIRVLTLYWPRNCDTRGQQVGEMCNLQKKTHGKWVGCIFSFGAFRVLPPLSPWFAAAGWHACTSVWPVRGSQRSPRNVFASMHKRPPPVKNLMSLCSHMH